MKMKWSIALALLSWLGVTSRGDAALIAYEGFDYAEGGSLIGANGGTGWMTAGAWADAPASQTGDNTEIGANGVRVSTGNAYPNRYLNVVPYGNAPFGHALNPVTELWISFLYTPNLESFGQLRLSSFGAEGGANLMSFGSSLGNAEVGAPGSMVLTPNVFTEGKTYLMVAQILFDTDTGANETVRLFVDPSLNSIPDLSSAVAFNDQVDFSFERIGLVAGSPTGSLFDEIRMGTTFYSVVPEPGSAVLLGGGVAGLMLWLRRRREA